MTTVRLRPSALHPQLRSFFRFVPNPPITRPWLLRLMQAGSTRASRPKLPASMTHRFVPLGDGAGVHVYRPEGDRPRAGVLWIHGGGFVVGSASQDHARCVRLATDLDVLVVSAEYRTAPGSPFPAALDDVHAAWTWLVGHVDELGIDPGRLAIGGQSAGGGLAAALVQRVHDAPGVQPVAQWLFCPMLDDRTAADRSLDPVRHYLWNNRSNRVGWRSYLGVEPGAPVVPRYAVPARRENLAGLPPTWIGCGDIELFHGEDRRYAEALTAAGVPTVLDVVQGAPHAFESISGGAAVSTAYLRRAEGWLRGHLAVGL
ncbi:alpha/beta hydrolase [Tessaracoccus palaemonis]|uniref:Alpha/beta hydrolase n=1 Tax=Tessaracoccus palaemonis TaxID=2829499 RepID=A0ABX8SMP8_9ACTN|nr:alpha/beta hydrolase [Tessaracoccus palaemonis]QXT63925.1 alpha/beta hydrolase [Tessaracoccus palaemonis]